MGHCKSNTFHVDNFGHVLKKKRSTYVFSAIFESQRQVSCLFFNDPQKADLTEMMYEKQNITLFVPSLQAISDMSKEDQDFWLSSSNTHSLVM